MPDIPPSRSEPAPRPRSAVYGIDGAAPRIDESAFIAPTAAIIGDVEIGADSSVWFHCVLRGDTNFIRIGQRSNVQDGTIVHVNSRHWPTIIGNDVTIGHASIIHACTLHDRAFVGMGATVLDGAVIEAGGMLAAGSLLTPGKVIGNGEMWTGSPARLKRVMDDGERARFNEAAAHYVELAARFRRGLCPASSRNLP